MSLQSILRISYCSLDSFVSNASAGSTRRKGSLDSSHKGRFAWSPGKPQWKMRDLHVLGAFKSVYTGRKYVRVLGAFRSVYTGRQYVRVLGAFRSVYTGRQYVHVLGAFRSVYTGRQYVRVLGAFRPVYTGKSFLCSAGKRTQVSNWGS